MDFQSPIPVVTKFPFQMALIMADIYQWGGGSDPPDETSPPG